MYNSTRARAIEWEAIKDPGQKKKHRKLLKLQNRSRIKKDKKKKKNGWDDSGGLEKRDLKVLMRLESRSLGMGNREIQDFSWKSRCFE